MPLPPTPPPSSTAAARVMRGNRRRDTGPEQRLRSLLHSRGLRFRVDHPVRLPEAVVRPDVVFTRRRVAVFVDGCFWHACPDHCVRPKSNVDFWEAKLARNAARDRRNDDLLARAGWRVVRAWEHDEPSEAAARVEVALAVSTTRHGTASTRG